MNRAQQRAHQTAKGQSKNQLLARAAAAEASTGMFKGFYEEQIRANERIVIEAEQLVQRAQAEQRATERTIEVMLFQLDAGNEPYAVFQDNIDAFNADDEEGEHFVHVGSTDNGFDMTLVFESFNTEEDGDEQQDERDVPEEDIESEDTQDSDEDGAGAPDGDSDDSK